MFQTDCENPSVVVLLTLVIVVFITKTPLDIAPVALAIVVILEPLISNFKYLTATFNQAPVKIISISSPLVGNSLAANVYDQNKVSAPVAAGV